MTKATAEILSLLATAESKIESMRLELARANKIPVARKIPASIEQVQSVVAMSFSRPVGIMTEKSRAAQIVWPRQIAMALAYELTGLTLMEIGQRFGGRDHGTVCHAIKTVANRCETDPDSNELVSRLRERLSAKK